MDHRGWIVSVALLAVAGGVAVAQTAALPPDIDARSRNRLPPVARDALDPAGQKIYDDIAGDGRSLAGFQGPAGIGLNAPALYGRWREVNTYLRYDAGLDPKLVEVTILALAREMDSRFEWHAHEANALKLGVAPATIDTIRRRGPLGALAAPDAVLVTLVREAIGERRVRPETFASALRAFGREKLTEYVYLIGAYEATATLLTAFDQQLPPGAVSALPPR